MTPKKSNPNDAIDLFEIERQARLLRATTTRDIARNIGKWFSARRSAPTSRLQPLKG